MLKPQIGFGEDASDILKNDVGLGSGIVGRHNMPVFIHRNLSGDEEEISAGQGNQDAVAVRTAGRGSACWMQVLDVRGWQHNKTFGSFWAVANENPEEREAGEL